MIVEVIYSRRLAILIAQCSNEIGDAITLFLDLFLSSFQKWTKNDCGELDY